MPNVAGKPFGRKNLVSTNVASPLNKKERVTFWLVKATQGGDRCPVRLDQVYGRLFSFQGSQTFFRLHPAIRKAKERGWDVIEGQ
jgi:hypothetical protein